MTKPNSEIARQLHEKYVYDVCREPITSEKFLDGPSENIADDIRKNFEERKERLKEKGLWKEI